MLLLRPRSCFERLHNVLAGLEHGQQTEKLDQYAEYHLLTGLGSWQKCQVGVVFILEQNLQQKDVERSRCDCSCLPWLAAVLTGQYAGPVPTSRQNPAT